MLPSVALLSLLLEAIVNGLMLSIPSVSLLLESIVNGLMLSIPSVSLLLESRRSFRFPFGHAPMCFGESVPLADWIFPDEDFINL